MNYLVKRESYIFENCTVKKWVDADTMYVHISVSVKIDIGFNNWVTTTGEADPDVRVLDLDTPEIFHPRNAAEKEHGLAALEFAKTLLTEPFSMQSFKTSNKDVHGRFLAKFTLADGSDYATVMKEAGFQKRKTY